MGGKLQALAEMTNRQTATTTVMQPSVDTRILNEPKNFSEKDADWNVWSLFFRSYCGALIDKLTDLCLLYCDSTVVMCEPVVHKCSKPVVVFLCPSACVVVVVVSLFATFATIIGSWKVSVSSVTAPSAALPSSVPV
eukprot:2431747-Amphidinium_carterae.1